MGKCHQEHDCPCLHQAPFLFFDTLTWLCVKVTGDQWQESWIRTLAMQNPRKGLMMYCAR